MRVLFLTRYDELGASSRYRSYQYLDYLRNEGITIDVSPLLDANYIRRIYSGRTASIPDLILSYARRLVKIIESTKYDVIWVEKEFLPWIPYWFTKAIYRWKIPYVVDLDDALFHRYDTHPNPLIRAILGKKIDHVMSDAAVVIAGNEYLAERAERAGAKRIEILPTVVNLEKYIQEKPRTSSQFTVGWIGTPATSHYLEGVIPALQNFCQMHQARLLTIGAGDMKTAGFDIENRSWSEETEVSDMFEFDIGIMPLPDSAWERGKCGLKLIQYMACEKPVVGSPVGVNRKIISDGFNGYKATSMEQWCTSLERLYASKDLREDLGRNGRKLVESEYSLTVAAPKLSNILRSVKEMK